VILIDTNLLLYATIEDFAEHDRTRAWLTAQFENVPKVGLPWHSVLGYVRLASNRSAFKRGRPVSEAWQIARRWLALDNVWIPQPTERHGRLINELIESSQVTSRSVMDIHLAALAIEHGLTLCSADNGFARYRNLRWLNPLED